MSFRFTKPKKIRPKLLVKRKSYEAQEVLTRLKTFLDSGQKEPMRILYGFWQNQQDAISYQEIRSAIEQGYVPTEWIKDWQQDYSKMVAGQFRNVWEEAMSKGFTGQPNMDNLKDFQLNMQSPGVLNWINARGADFVTNSTKEQREAIKTLLVKSVTEKYDAEELARLIRPTIGLTKGQTSAGMKYYDNVVKTLTENHPKMSAESIKAKAYDATLKYSEKLHMDRAYTIAHTERAFAFNRGADEGIRQAMAMGLLPPQEKVWSTSGGEHVCEDCQALEGEVVGMDDGFFESRGLFRGDDLLPPLHPRCECAVQYKDAEKAEKPNATGLNTEDEFDYKNLRSLYDYNNDKIDITDNAINRIKKVYLSGYNYSELINLQEKHKDILRLSKEKNQSMEVAVVTLLTNNENITVYGTENQVGLGGNPEIKRIIMMSGYNTVCISHNHPNCTTFSYDDLDVFMNPAVKSLTIVTNKGKVMALNKKKNIDYLHIFEYIKSVKSKYSFEKEQPKIMKELLKGLQDFGIEYIR